MTTIYEQAWQEADRRLKTAQQLLDCHKRASTLVNEMLVRLSYDRLTTLAFMLNRRRRTALTLAVVGHESRPAGMGNYRTAEPISEWQQRNQQTEDGGQPEIWTVPATPILRYWELNNGRIKPKVRYFITDATGELYYQDASGRLWAIPSTEEEFVQLLEIPVLTPKGKTAADVLPEKGTKVFVLGVSHVKVTGSDIIKSLPAPDVIECEYVGLVNPEELPSGADRYSAGVRVSDGRCWLKPLNEIFYSYEDACEALKTKYPDLRELFSANSIKDSLTKEEEDWVKGRSHDNVSNLPVVTARYVVEVAMNEDSLESTDEEHRKRFSDELQRALDDGYFADLRYDAMTFRVVSREVLDTAPARCPNPEPQEADHEYAVPLSPVDPAVSDLPTQSQGPE